MNKIATNTINEFERLFLKRKNIIFLIITALICFVSALLLNTIQARLSFVALSAISFPLLTLSIFTNTLLPLFTITITSEVFSGEEGSKTLKLVFLRPISRFKIFVSKNIAIIAYIAINFAIVFTASMISGLLFNKIEAYESIGKILSAYCIDLLPAVVFVLFAALIAQFFKSSGAALSVGIFIFMLLKVLSLILSIFNNIIFTSYLNWYNIFYTGSYLRNLNILFMVMAYGIIFFTIGFYIFDKKEV